MAVADRPEKCRSELVPKKPCGRVKHVIDRGGKPPVFACPYCDSTEHWPRFKEK